MKKYKCPCCNNFTFVDKPDGNYAICPVCFWEDDPLAYDDPDEECSCNGVSLNQAKYNYISFDACCLEMRGHVRKPFISETVNGES